MTLRRVAVVLLGTFLAGLAFVWLGRLLAPLLLVRLRPRLGVSPRDLRPVDRIAGLGAPLLLIAGARDGHTTPADTARLFAAAHAPKGLWTIENAGHVDFHSFAASEYERRVGTFLERCLTGPEDSVAKL